MKEILTLQIEEIRNKIEEKRKEMEDYARNVSTLAGLSDDDKLLHLSQDLDQLIVELHQLKIRNSTLQPWEMMQTQFIHLHPSYQDAVSKINKAFRNMAKPHYRSSGSVAGIREKSLARAIEEKSRAEARAIRQHKQYIIKAMKNGLPVPEENIHLYFSKV